MINEEDEEESEKEELQQILDIEEANVGLYPNIKDNLDQNQQSSEVAELRNQLREEISELNSKLTRVENQLSLLIRLMQNPKSKPELQPRHSQSFPIRSTSSSSPSAHDSRKDHNSSVLNAVATDDSENSGSPSWLSPTSVRSNRSSSDPNNRKELTRVRNDDTMSPVVNLARHGRRKTSDA